MNGRLVLQKDDVEGAAGRAVSRETLERLESFGHALLKWSPKINLIAKNTFDDLWNRHIIDSVQLAGVVTDKPDAWCDLGTGGGLPGLVLACLGAEIWPETSFEFIESDARKAAFLTMISNELGLKTVVTRKRIELAPPADASHVSARALAPLPLLLDYCHRHLREGGMALLPKGRNRGAELEAAARTWQFELETTTSRVDPESAILVIRHLRPREASS